MNSSIDLDAYLNLPAFFTDACQRFATRPAFSCLGKTLSYARLYELSGAFAAWLQTHTDLQPGERIAVQLPNVLQFPVVALGALRAGLVLVSVNPLYSVRELEHQLNDSGATALVCLANTAQAAAEVLPRTSVRHLVSTEVGDLLPWPRRWLVNAAMRYVKKQVPVLLPNAVPLRQALHLGKGVLISDYSAVPEALAALQYTGGTTGVAKGAMLTHRNLLANMQQCRALMIGHLGSSSATFIAPLPLYHIYAFTFHGLALLSSGHHSVLIPNPRDISSLINELKRWPFNGFVGLSTLFSALCRQPEFRELDFSALCLTLSGGMALPAAVAEEWQTITGCPVCEGYGLTEASPVVAVNPANAIQVGTIGVPLPLTTCHVFDEHGRELPQGEAGELCVKGPQVMAGYWQRPEETAATIDADGWLHTGDIAMIQADGYLRIIDRKKDLIVVSGFNVYPSEIEDVLMMHIGVRVCCAIGVPDVRTGEAVRLFVVPQVGQSLDAAELTTFLRARLAAYKVPKCIEFREHLPTSTVGKILRRELRAEVLAKNER